jgi:hypothetical protein
MDWVLGGSWRGGLFMKYLSESSPCIELICKEKNINKIWLKYIPQRASLVNSSYEKRLENVGYYGRTCFRIRSSCLFSCLPPSSANLTAAGSPSVSPQSQMVWSRDSSSMAVASSCGSIIVIVMPGGFIIIFDGPWVGVVCWCRWSASCHCSGSSGCAGCLGTGSHCCCHHRSLASCCGLCQHGSHHRAAF